MSKRCARLRDRLRAASMTAAAGCVLALGAGHAHAQARPTASRGNDVSLFAGVAGANPQYGGASDDYGFLIGGDYTRHLHLFSPSIEARYTRVTGTQVNESTFLGGFKAEKLFAGRFHPYVDALFGQGNIQFNQPVLFNGVPYDHDNSFVYDFGAGVDVDITSRVALKGDFQYSHWHTGSEVGAFTPGVVSVGAIYRFRFGR